MNRQEYYEEVIQKTLQTEHRCTQEESIQIYEKYRKLQKYIQGYSLLSISNIFYNAYKTGIDPEKWKAHIEKNEKIFYELDGKTENISIEEQKKQYDRGDLIKYEQMGYFDQEVIREMVLIYRHELEESLKLFNNTVPLLINLDISQSTPQEIAEILVKVKEKNIKVDKLMKTLTQDKNNMVQ